MAINKIHDVKNFSVQLTTILLLMALGCGEDPAFKNIAAQDPNDPNGMNNEMSLEDGLSKDRLDKNVEGDLYKSSSESFVANSERSNVLDILMVVDNSMSMKEEQVRLGDKLSALLSSLGTTDWQVAITTTDPRHGGKLKGFLSKSDSSKTFRQKVTEFKSVVTNLGSQGSGNEQGIPMAVRALNRPKVEFENEKWVRDEGYVAVVIVSDEDNCSDGSRCIPFSQNHYEYLTEYLSGDKGEDKLGRTLGETAKVYGLLRRTENECRDAEHVAGEYLKAIDASGGIAGAICKEDYTPILSEISRDIANAIDVAFELEFEPIEDSIAVLVNGNVFDGDIRVEGKRVFLLWQDIAIGADISIDYKYIP